METALAIRSELLEKIENESYLEQWLSRYPETTKRAYRNDLQEFFEFCGIAEKDACHILNSSNVVFSLAHFWRNSMVGKMSTASVARKVAAVRSYFDYLLDMRVISDNPFRGVKCGKVRNEKKDPLTDEEVAAIFEVIDRTTKRGKRDYALIMAMIELGFRREEVLSLRYGSLHKDADGRSFVRFIGKGGDEYEMPISDTLRLAIADYLTARRIFALNDETPIFANPSGKPLSRSGLYKLVGVYAKQAGIDKPISPHAFRHYAITDVMKHVGTAEGMVFSRHKHVSTLMRYTHLNRMNTIREIQGKRGVE